MNIQSDKLYRVYLKEHEGRKFYKIKLSKKNQEGTYVNGYLDIKFKNGEEVENEAQIYLKNAFLTFYLTKDKKTIPYIQVIDFERLSETIERNKENDVEKNENATDLFEEFGKEHKDDDFELPF